MALISVRVIRTSLDVFDRYEIGPVFYLLLFLMIPFISSLSPGGLSIAAQLDITSLSLLLLAARPVLAVLIVAI